MKRFGFIDDYRGFAVISMILVNFLAYYTVTPEWLKHATGTGYTFADLVAPMFLFVLGIMFRRALLSRISTVGPMKAHLLIIRRLATIMIIGFAGSALAKGNFRFEWGILQAIGLAGLLALPFSSLRWETRSIVFVLLLLIYQYLVLPQYENLILTAKHGGTLASLSWACIIIAATIAGDFFHHKKIELAFRLQIIYTTLLSITAAILIILLSPAVSKLSVNMTYIVLSVALSSLTFIMFMYAGEKKKIRILGLGILGKNALVIFLFHYLIVKIMHKLTSKLSSILEVSLYAIFVLFLCLLTAWYLNYKKWYLKI